MNRIHDSNLIYSLILQAIDEGFQSFQEISDYVDERYSDQICISTLYRYLNTLIKRNILFRFQLLRDTRKKIFVRSY